jgi:hypothetical protein
VQFEEQQPAATGIATTVSVPTVPVLAAGSSYNRIAITIQPTDRIVIGLASNFNATTAAIMDVPSGTVFEERDYKGDIYVKAEGAAVPVRLWETRF